MTFLPYSQGMESWKISSLSTGYRQLVIVSLLRPFLDSPGEFRSHSQHGPAHRSDYERAAADVIAFYSASLPSDIEEPDLDTFADFYLDPCGECSDFPLSRRLIM